MRELSARGGVARLKDAANAATSGLRDAAENVAAAEIGLALREGRSIGDAMQDGRRAVEAMSSAGLVVMTAERAARLLDQERQAGSTGSARAALQEDEWSASVLWVVRIAAVLAALALTQAVWWLA